MVSEKSIDAQLKRIGFNRYGWGRGEINELHNIILPDEEIFECVNGMYEGGFAMAIATDVRVLLVDKKPLNFLIVEDLRFDLISEIDYHHRLLGAYISISTGSKNLKFRSYNQPRLRKLIGHVQHCMAEIKKKQTYHQEGQNLHLERINQQLQAYLIAQHQQHQEIQAGLGAAQLGSGAAAPPPEPVRPSPELADYLFAQSLLAQYQAQAGQGSETLPPQAAGFEQLEAARQAVRSTATVPPAVAPAQPAQAPSPAPLQSTPLKPEPSANPATPSPSEIYADGMQEIFGKHQQAQAAANDEVSKVTNQSAVSQFQPDQPAEINPLKIAYSKLPLVLRTRKFRKQSSFWPAPEIEPI